jgi:hypothetical protein
MDENKLKKLVHVGYEIRKCCGLCKHGQFKHDDWGTCKLHDYEHLKHTQSKRQLSIYRYGTCSNVKYKEREALGAWAEFWEK